MYYGFAEKYPEFGISPIGVWDSLSIARQETEKYPKAIILKADHIDAFIGNKAGIMSHDFETFDSLLSKLYNISSN